MDMNKELDTSNMATPTTYVNIHSRLIRIINARGNHRILALDVDGQLWGLISPIDVMELLACRPRHADGFLANLVDLTTLDGVVAVALDDRGSLWSHSEGAWWPLTVSRKVRD